MSAAADGGGAVGGSSSAEGERQEGGPREEEMTYSQIMHRKISSMLQEAERLHKEVDPKLAIKKLTRAIALDRCNPALFLQRAEAHFSLEDYHAAAINYQKVLSLNPNEGGAIRSRLAAVHALHGQSLVDGGCYEDALGEFDSALRHCPGEKEYVMKKIWCLLALKRYGECLERVEAELITDCTNPQLHLLRAQLNLLFGNTTQAYWDASSALDLDSAYHEASHLKQELEEKAQHCKNQAIQCSLVGKKIDAMKKITTAIETDPTVAEFHVIRGALHRRMSDFNSAMDDYLTAMDKCGHRQDSQVYIRASRQLVLTYNDFAVECFGKRYFSEAVTLLNKAIKEEKMEKGLYLNRGDCFYRMNNLPFALADYQQALELSPTDWGVQCRVAVVLCELGIQEFGREQFSRAEELFSSAVSYNPKVSRFYVCRARARHEGKNSTGTKEDILAALLLDPDNDECLPLIARVFPGKSKTDLLQSRDAETVSNRLGSVAQSRPPEAERGAVPVSNSKGLLSYDLQLRLSSEDTPLTQAPPTPASEEGEGEGGMVGFDERAGEEGRKETEASESALSPRQWHVLDSPVPALDEGTSPSVMPPLRACMHEEDFHAMIYYSKKKCTDEVQLVLNCPTHIGPVPPKLQAHCGAKFGARTVAQK